MEATTDMSGSTARDQIEALRERMGEAIIGQREVIERLLIGLLANGNRAANVSRVRQLLATPPPEADDDQTTDEANTWLHNGLYTLDESLTPVPDIAAELAEISEDGLTWTIKLREDVFFQPTGEQVTAEDVVFTFELANSPNCTFNPDSCLAFVTVLPEGAEEPVKVLQSVQALDDFTVEFQMADKYAPFTTVSLPGLGIDSKTATEAAFASFQEGLGAVTAADVVLDGEVDAAADVGADLYQEAPNRALVVHRVEGHGAMDVGLGQPERVHLHAVPEPARLWILHPVSVQPDAIPHRGHRPQLADLLHEPDPGIDEEGDRAEHLPEPLGWHLPRVAYRVEDVDRRFGSGAEQVAPVRREEQLPAGLLRLVPPELTRLGAGAEGGTMRSAESATPAARNLS